MVLLEDRATSPGRPSPMASACADFARLAEAEESAALPEKNPTAQRAPGPPDVFAAARPGASQAGPLSSVPPRRAVRDCSWHCLSSSPRRHLQCMPPRWCRGTHCRKLVEAAAKLSCGEDRGHHRHRSAVEASCDARSRRHRCELPRRTRCARWSEHTALRGGARVQAPPPQVRVDWRPTHGRRQTPHAVGRRRPTARFARPDLLQCHQYC